MNFVKIVLPAFFVLTASATLTAQQKAENTEGVRVLAVVQSFFDALEKQDTAALNKMFLPDARNFSVRELPDSVVIRSQASTSFRFNSAQIIRERMRSASTEVKIHGRIAMVWAPYDLWINDFFSHCGVDVFTLIKSSKGWKITSVAYTLETQRCK
jgi:hypothetical protein